MNDTNVKTDIAPITISSTAIAQLNRIRQEQDINESHSLRVGVKGGGCSGFSYILGFDERKEKDQLYIIDGIEVLMDQGHALYLMGIEIDWVEGLENRGFTFTNPNAKETCGCGTSFSA